MKPRESWKNETGSVSGSGVRQKQKTHFRAEVGDAGRSEFVSSFHFLRGGAIGAAEAEAGFAANLILARRRAHRTGSALQGEEPQGRDVWQLVDHGGKDEGGGY